LILTALAPPPLTRGIFFVCRDGSVHDSTCYATLRNLVPNVD